MSEVILILGLAFVFMLCQGIAVVGTAFLICKTFGLTHWAAKICMVALSYCIWLVSGFVIWDFLGGGFALMEGGVPFFGMSFTSIIGSLVVLVFWIVYPNIARRRFNG